VVDARDLVALADKAAPIEKRPEIDTGAGVREAFPDDASVNRALRRVLEDLRSRGD
jgi:hypothetical protein